MTKRKQSKKTDVATEAVDFAIIRISALHRFLEHMKERAVGAGEYMAAEEIEILSVFADDILDNLFYHQIKISGE